VPGGVPPDFETTTYLPSGVHSGDVKASLRFSLVSALASVPSALATQTFSAPSRSDRNTRRLPSGE
jgi:hypothetical protein